MVHAFIMVETLPGRAEAIRESVAALDAVTEAHVVAGQFDVIAEVDAAEVYDVLHTSSSAVQGMDGVSDTTTYVALD